MLALAQATSQDVVKLIPVPGSFDGVTTAIVAFILTAMAFPKVIRHRSQFYAAFFVTVGVLLIGTLRHMLYDSAGFQVIGGVFMGVLQIGALLLLFFSAGGLSVGQFADEAREAIDVIRRGGEKKEVIVPLTGERPRPRDGGAGHAGPVDAPRGGEEPVRLVYTINDDLDPSQASAPSDAAVPPPPPVAPDARKPDNARPLPIE